ncbi:UDP-rhamnose/UDP-galactose transporter 1 [Citrus sinensis]|nr:UDP-rhamnose/UDP-galactose transporter 1 [Citrus sinensis]
MEAQKQKESKSSSSSVSNVGAWGMNIVSSVGIIMANKQLMSPSGLGFGFATTLTGFHFAVTALVGLVSNATGYSNSASIHVPFWELFWFSIVANTSITGMNFSLMLNSVGFYQISKLSMIPVVCVMEWILHGKKYCREVKMAVVVVVVGVGVCTVTDVKVNAKGFICACVAVFSTSLQQISIGSLQKKYSVGSFELLSKTAPIQAVSLLVFGPFIDYYLSGKLLSNYRFSSSAFLTVKNILGMTVAVLGMIVYSWAIEAEKRKPDSKTIGHTKNNLLEEHVELLKQRIEESPAKDVELGQAK